MPSFGSKIVVDSVKSLAKLKVKDNDYSSVIYKPSCFITEGNQVSEVSFTLGKCTLAVLVTFSFLCPEKYSKRTRISTWAAVRLSSQQYPFGLFFQDGQKICLSPVIGDLSQSPWYVLAVSPSSSLSTLGCSSVDPMHVYGSSSPMQSLT